MSTKPFRIPDPSAVPKHIADAMGIVLPSERLSGSRWTFFRCTTCATFWVTVDKDVGLTPQRMRCKDRPAVIDGVPGRLGNCDGVMHSAGYPAMKDWPDIVPKYANAEWYAPPRKERRTLRMKNPGLYQYVIAGGLLMQPPTQEYDFHEEMTHAEG